MYEAALGGGDLDQFAWLGRVGGGDVIVDRHQAEGKIAVDHADVTLVPALFSMDELPRAGRQSRTSLATRISGKIVRASRRACFTNRTRGLLRLLQSTQG